MTKNLVGAGVLSLSGGIALFSNDSSAMLLASTWVILLGLMFGYFGLLIAKICDKTQSSTYRECWEATMGPRGGVAVALISTLLPAQGDISYATVLSQTLKSLLETVHIYWSRVTCLLIITVFGLLPLCLMKDLDALAPFSVFGVAAVGISMIAMLIRCFDGSYQPGGAYYDSIREEFQPSFGNETHAWSLEILPFVCMIFQAWVMHYNIPRFYAELKDASIPRFTGAIGISFALAATMYIIIAAAGFWTFGGNSQSYILNNYSPDDPLATASRVGVFISTLLIYPLAFIGVRDGCLDVLQVPMHRQTTLFLNVVSVILLTILTLLAVVFHDLGLINAVGGGAFATFLCVIFPTLMFRQAVKQSPETDPSEEQEVKFALVLMLVGLLLGLIGVWQSISDALSSGATTFR
jgi:amino acid permease